VRRALEMAASRFADLARVIKTSGSYDNPGFMEKSAERCRAALATAERNAARLTGGAGQSAQDPFDHATDVNLPKHAPETAVGGSSLTSNAPSQSDLDRAREIFQSDKPSGFVWNARLCKKIAAELAAVRREERERAISQFQTPAGSSPGHKIISGLKEAVAHAKGEAPARYGCGHWHGSPAEAENCGAVRQALDEAAKALEAVSGMLFHRPDMVAALRPMMGPAEHAVFDAAAATLATIRKLIPDAGGESDG
jgi:hypothetical protein